MGLSVGYPPSLEELYRQMSSSPAFAQMMQRQDAKDGGGGSSDPRSWLQARMRTHGLNIPPMPQQAAPPQQMPSQALGAPPQMPTQAPMPMGLPPMPQTQNRQSGGFLSGLIPEGGEFKERLGDMLMGFGGGRTWQDSLAQGGQAIAEGRRARAPLRAQTAQDNRTRQYAMRLGMDPNMAAGLDGPNLMKWIMEKGKAPDPMDALQQKKLQLEIGNMENPQPDKPDLVTLVSPDGKQRRSVNAADSKMEPIIQQYLGQGWVPADDLPDAPKAPEMDTLYDQKTGQAYKAQWNPTTGQWDRVGGNKESDSGITITNPDGTTTQIGGSGSKTTQADRQAMLLAQQMVGQETQLIKNFDTLAAMRNSVGSDVPGGRAIMSSEGQQASDALKNVIANWLYIVSGATANPGEVANQFATLKPSVFDSPETIAAKKARLQSMIDTMKQRAGIQIQPGDVQDGTGGGLPDGVTQEEWDAMTPEERALWN